MPDFTLDKCERGVIDFARQLVNSNVFSVQRLCQVNLYILGTYSITCGRHY